MRRKSDDDMNVKTEPKKRSGQLVGFLVCLILAVVVFVSVILIERKAVRQVESVDVVVALAEVPANAYIDESNYATYFALQSRVSAELPEDAVLTLDDVRGKYVTRTIPLNSTITYGDFKEIDMYEGIENPVEVSFLVGDLSQVVAGIIREGDYVNIDVLLSDEYLLEEKDNEITSESITVSSSSLKEQTITSESAPIVEETLPDVSVGDVSGNNASEIPLAGHACYTFMENVRVSKVFTNAGVRITAEMDALEDASHTAMLINLIIPEEKESEFNRIVEDGIIRLSKVPEGMNVDVSASDE